MAIGCCKSSLYDDSLSGVVVAILFLLSLLNITTNFLSVCHMLISTLYREKYFAFGPAVGLRLTK